MSTDVQQFEVEVKVKGGFPVIAVGEIYPADPDVGFPRRYLGCYELLTMKRKSASWLKLSRPDEVKLDEDIWDQIYKGESDE